VSPAQRPPGSGGGGGSGGESENARLSRDRDLTRGREQQRALRSRARERSPHRPRVDVSVNEFSGTVSWRTPTTPMERRARTASRHTDGTPAPQRPRSPAEQRVARAAMLRSAGLDPARSRGSGAAPVPAHPATVLAATHAPTHRMAPGELNGHLARVGALRSRLQGDLARSARMPAPATAALRSGVNAARVHSLRTEQSATVRKAASSGGHGAGSAQSPAHLRPHRQARTQRPDARTRPAP
jgi:hypothetical protein